MLHAGPCAELRCHGRRAAALGRRDHPRQDRDDRARDLCAGQDPQPGQPRAHAGRFVERVGCSRGRAHGAGGHRHPDQRQRDPAGSVLRRLRLQADLRLVPRHGVLEQSRPLDQIGFIARTRRGRRAHRRGADRLRRAPTPTPARWRAPGCTPWRWRSRRCRRRSPSRARRTGPTPTRRPARRSTRSRRHSASMRSRSSVPAIFRDAWGWHATVMEADIARNFHHDYERGGDAHERVASQPDRARPPHHRGRLQQRRGPDRRDERGLRRNLRPLRRDPHRGGRGPGAARARARPATRGSARCGPMPACPPSRCRC